MSTSNDNNKCLLMPILAALVHEDLFKGITFGKAIHMGEQETLHVRTKPIISQMPNAIRQLLDGVRLIDGLGSIYILSNIPHSIKSVLISEIFSETFFEKRF